MNIIYIIPFLVLIFILIVLSIFYILLLRKFEYIDFKKINKKPTNDKIDAVYTWVNGSDKEWLKKKNFYTGDDKLSDIRFNSELGNSELKVSIHSLYKFAPWINHIYIVVMRPQNPMLPKELMRKVTIVYHDQIWENPEHLPVFNSHAIESQIHRIPNLSEKFIYLNDDIYFTNYVYPYHFFHNDKPVYRGFILPNKIIKNLIPKKFNNDFLLATYNVGNIYFKKNIFMFRFYHFSVPLLKSSMSISSKSKELKNEWNKTSKSKLRSKYDIPPIHASVIWCLINKKGLIVKNYSDYWKGIYICDNNGPFSGMCDYRIIPDSITDTKPSEICVNNPKVFNKFKNLMYNKILK